MSLWNLTGGSTALLLTCLSNFRAIRWILGASRLREIWLQNDLWFIGKRPWCLKQVPDSLMSRHNTDMIVFCNLFMHCGLLMAHGFKLPTLGSANGVWIQCHRQRPKQRKQSTAWTNHELGHRGPPGFNKVNHICFCGILPRIPKHQIKSGKKTTHDQ